MFSPEIWHMAFSIKNGNSGGRRRDEIFTISSPQKKKLHQQERKELFDSAEPLEYNLLVFFFVVDWKEYWEIQEAQTFWRRRKQRKNKKMTYFFLGLSLSDTEKSWLTVLEHFSIWPKWPFSKKEELWLVTGSQDVRFFFSVFSHQPRSHPSY